MFFFNDTATTEIYTLSLHDALPISPPDRHSGRYKCHCRRYSGRKRSEEHTSELQSHSFISYAVFCLKKNTDNTPTETRWAGAQSEPKTVFYNHTLAPRSHT